MKFFSLILITVLLGGTAGAQEINFSRVQDMTTWYNQSLKTDKNSDIKFNMRSVKYDGMMAYKSVAAMIDLPLLSKDSRQEENSGYLSLSVGGASDKSNEGILNNTLGLVGLSYAVPIGKNETYIAFGAQGSYYQSKLNVGNTVAFGDQYDQYGPVEGLQSSDRLASGWSYSHISVNAGLSVFSNAASNKWYVGASVLQINKPYTDDKKTADFRLNQMLSIQGGYKYITPQGDNCSVNMTLNWQGKAYKHFLNVTYFKAIPNMPAGVGFGLGYRYDDALVPNIDLKYSKITVGLLYDVNISAFNPAGFKRNGMELAVKLDF